MSRSVYLAAPEGLTGKSAIAVGLLDLLVREVGAVGIFRPVVDDCDADVLADLLIDQPGVRQRYEDVIGVTYRQYHANPDEAMHTIVERFGRLTDEFEILLVLGSDYTDVATGTELTLNAQIAANLGAPVVLVVHGRERTPSEVLAATESALDELRLRHALPVAVIANRIDPEQTDLVRELLTTSLGASMLVTALPEAPVLSAPTVRAQAAAVDATLLVGAESWLDRESGGLIVAAMSLPNVLPRLFPEATVIMAGDRPELLPGLLMAHQSGSFPTLSGVILTGGFEVPEPVLRLLAGVAPKLPILTTARGTYTTASILGSVRGPITSNSAAKLEIARRLFAENIPAEAMLQAVQARATATAEQSRFATGVRTPLMFEFQLLERARAAGKHIVLPESDDDRILTAAAILLRRGVARLTLLGDQYEVRARASKLGLDLNAAAVVSPTDSELVERFAESYTQARAHKGMTLERARTVVTDVSYFGTMMVHHGLADGMVSGAVHTTAHTIRPALEFVKTRPGVQTVSSVFLMCLADRVLVYGDCAVVPDPTAEQLADIAISSAATAAEFGIEPRVAMLSYSTGSSGTGADVDKVRAATALVAARRPDLLLEGPIQYDAAVDAGVARTKLPNSEVAGRATVFVFPDLNTGNNTYKAVQRSAHAIAVGPVLQGLRRPVNDLSRGALVDDIVNTVAITAVQASAGDS